MDDRSGASLWLPLAGSGLELASATLVGLGIGYVVDRWVIGGGNGATVAGLLIGFGLGMFRFVRWATVITRRVAESQSSVSGSADRSVGWPADDDDGWGA